MRFLVKIGLGFLAFLLVIYLAIAAYLYTRQDGMIFPGNRLAANYHFKYTYPYTEYKIKNGKNILSGLLFKAQKPKGLIFYLHGNSNNLKTWGDIAPAYTALNYDLFILDYPGYGKSTGRINNEAQLLKAVQVAFDSLKTVYKPQDIVIMGYSIGTGPAAWLAGRRPNKALVLLAPYYSLTDLIHSRYPFMPASLAKYHLKTYSFIEQVKTPVYIFHGDADDVIAYQASVKLKEHLKPGDKLTILKGEDHIDLHENKTYIKQLSAILK